MSSPDLERLSALSSKPMRAYIEIAGTTGSLRYEFHDYELRSIGEFTRENILRWLENSYIANSVVGLLPVRDFHAVCGDIEIPWATKEKEGPSDFPF